MQNISTKLDGHCPIKKSPVTAGEQYTLKSELSDYTYTVYNSLALVCILQARASLRFPEKFFENLAFVSGVIKTLGVEGLRKGKSSPAFAVAKGGDTMNEPIRSQWQIRCAFNGFCKRTLKNEAINAHRDTKRQQLREVSFSDLSPQEEKQLYTYDTYFADDEAEKSFCVAGKEITAKLLAEALHSLPEEKRDAVLLYYFFEMSDVEIGKLRNVPRSTVQYRRTSSFELLKRYLEERAYDTNDW